MANKFFLILFCFLSFSCATQEGRDYGDALDSTPGEAVLGENHEDDVANVYFSVYHNGSTSILNYVNYFQTICNNGDEFFNTDKKPRLLNKPTKVKPPLSTLWIRKNVTKMLHQELNSIGISTEVANVREVSKNELVYHLGGKERTYCRVHWTALSDGEKIQYKVVCSDSSLDFSATGVTKASLDSALEERGLSLVMQLFLPTSGLYIKL